MAKLQDEQELLVPPTQPLHDRRRIRTLPAAWFGPAYCSQTTVQKIVGNIGWPHAGAFSTSLMQWQLASVFGGHNLASANASDYSGEVLYQQLLTNVLANTRPVDLVELPATGDVVRACTEAEG